MIQSQKNRLLKYLKEGKLVTRITAMRDLGIMELSSRIVSLENDGVEIKKGWTKQTNRFGETYRLRTYCISALENHPEGI